VAQQEGNDSETKECTSSESWLWFRKDIPLSPGHDIVKVIIKSVS